MSRGPNLAFMEREYKLIYRDESGTKGSLSLPPFLIENRKELWRAAFRDATARLQSELEGTPPAELQPHTKELAMKHLGYFNEYMDDLNVSRSVVENTELAWTAMLDETILKKLGRGDAEVGVHEIIIAICHIADDEMEPLIQAYRRLNA
jgi:hypothetical protein